MKRKLLLLSVMVICIAIAAVGTLAYYNTNAIAHNVITTGGVNIELHEYADAEKTQPFKDLSGVMPGIKVTKIAEVENTGASAAWVRVKLTPAIELADDAVLPDGFTVNTGLVKPDVNTTDWELRSDGYYYYHKALAAGETTTPVITSVTFKETMGNEYQGATATVDIVAQAVQVANNGKTVMDAQRWPKLETGVVSGVTG